MFKKCFFMLLPPIYHFAFPHGKARYYDLNPLLQNEERDLFNYLDIFPVFSG